MRLLVIMLGCTQQCHIIYPTDTQQTLITSQGKVLQEQAVPVAVEQVLMRALAKDPAQRFPSIQTFALVLEQAYKQSQVAQHRPAAPQPDYVAQLRGRQSVQSRQFQPVAPYVPQSRD